MKKILTSLLILMIMFSTISLAAYPAELEGENEEGLVEFVPSSTDSEETAEDETTLEKTENLEDEDNLLISDYNFDFDESEVIDDDMYVMEENVKITQVIDGNLYIMAKNVKLDSASVLGNVYIMAESIEMENSSVNASIFLMGKDIRISGTDVEDAYIMGMNVDILEDTTVWRNAKILAKTLNIDGEIDRDVYASVETLNVGKNANIEGKLVYSSEKEGQISNSARIGSIEFSAIDTDVDEEIANQFRLIDFIEPGLAFAFKTLIISLIIVFLVNKFKTMERSENIGSDCLKAFGKGAGVLVLVPIISVLFFVSVLGIGLGLGLIAIYVILLYIAKSIFAIEVAQRITFKKNIEGKAKFVGLSVLVAIVIWAIGLIPVIGGIVKLIVMLAGLGILFDLIFKKAKKVGENEIVNEN